MDCKDNSFFRFYVALIENFVYSLMPAAYSGMLVTHDCSRNGDIEKRTPCNPGFFSTKILRLFACRFSSAFTSIGIIFSPFCCQKREKNNESDAVKRIFFRTVYSANRVVFSPCNFWCAVKNWIFLCERTDLVQATTTAIATC